MKTMPEHARLIVTQALQAADAARALKKALCRQGSILTLGNWRFNLDNYEQILVIGAGKASASMALALEEVLDRPLSGLVAVKDGHLAPCRQVRLLEASHPLPDARSEEAGLLISRLVSRAGAGTLIFNLLSGGGSSLLTAPAEGLSLADKQAVSQALLAAGADIRQINTVRKRLSRLKGGGLARLAAPATLVSLIVSDVIDNSLEVIASGPTVADRSTWREVADILNYFSLEEKIPSTVRQRVKAGLEGRAEEIGEESFSHVFNYIIADNRLALNAACEKAGQLGYNPLLLSSSLAGDTEEAAGFHMAVAREVRQWGQPLVPPACLISGGETVVSLPPGHGLGGRNQHFALAALKHIRDLAGVTALSLGTDGNDGPTAAAGAWVDSHTRRQGEELGLNYRDALTNCDAYHFFQRSGNLIVTGPTNTNVMDLRLILIEKI
jgi:hydroxypyruvate reductase